jgi:hypothetical protein
MEPIFPIAIPLFSSLHIVPTVINVISSSAYEQRAKEAINTKQFPNGLCGVIKAFKMSLKP